MAIRYNGIQPLNKFSPGNRVIAGQYKRIGGTNFFKSNTNIQVNINNGVNPFACYDYGGCCEPKMSTFEKILLGAGALLGGLGAFLGLGKSDKTETDKESKGSVERQPEKEVAAKKTTSTTSTTSKKADSMKVIDTSNNQVTATHNFTYDSLGRKKETKVSTGETIEYSYSGSSTKPSKQVLKDANGKITETREYTYDENGELKTTKVTDEDGTVTIMNASDPAPPEPELDEQSNVLDEVVVSIRREFDTE